MSLDLEKYRQMLIKERADLTDEIGGINDDDTRIASDSNQDAIEVAQHGPQTDVTAHVRDMKSHRLVQVNEALARIERGDYGKCIVCGNEVDPRRLDADPASLTDVEHADAILREQSAQTPTL
ncbi:MAG TPA: TraR/DksA C4-type zinc finger protein [Blastocatellia bacterium]|nr:TraR/DksA C4-type zinc finger protein [Blastocatellia bacterium]